MFDWRLSSTNRNGESVEVAQSQAKEAGLVADRASEEEEVFLVAILDVRGDCLARRIENFI